MYSCLLSYFPTFFTCLYDGFRIKLYLCKQKTIIIMNNADLPQVLQNEVQYQDLFFYQKTEVLYALTFHFAKRFRPVSGDRTVDQMVQAARSGKQNIV